MVLPAHVADIAPDHLRLGGDCKVLLSELRGSPYGERLFRNAQLQPCLRIDAPNPLASPGLTEVLAWLTKQGVALLELYDQPYGPAEIGRALQAEGAVGSFSSLLMRTPEDWDLIAHPLAEEPGD